MQGIERLKEHLNSVMVEKAATLRFAGYEDLISRMAAANGVDWRIQGYTFNVSDLASGGAEVLAVRRGLSELAGIVEESRLIYIGLDNAGEAVVDLLAAAWLADRGHKVVLVARSEAYEVDVTHEEAQALARALGLEGRGLKILGTGTMYPPLYRSALRGEPRRLLDRADLVIGKGIGNLEASLETLEMGRLSRTLNLFKAKCGALSRITGRRGVAVATLASDFLETLKTPGQQEVPKGVG
jgi:uncharacterized protein with ATP-grasp and redox domains